MGILTKSGGSFPPVSKMMSRSTRPYREEKEREREVRVNEEMEGEIAREGIRENKREIRDKKI